MTALWREELIPVNPFTRPGTPLRLVRNIIIHYTGNPGASAANHVIYFGKTLPATNERYASAHYFVDPGDAILIIPLDEQAYHASQANPYSIGVEMCIEPDGSFHLETVRRTVAIVAELCRRYELNPLRDVIRHYDVTGKHCPAPYIDDPGAWEEFKRRVANGDEEDDTMKLEQWQWKMLGDALDGLYRKGLLGDYGWATKAYEGKLTQTELAWINTVVFAREKGVVV
ncbi:N-acetylmuramoyl-L-alanine amidase [Paenibacillus sp. GYB004]|uniref:peptidoglycan recognition protein family protein n=1 Tax=Paenibacillus sp. GYB004 TaxID=2994393 RepID=UPI002F967C12